MPVTLQCEVCKKAFSVKPFHAKGRRFCSIDCKRAWHLSLRVSRSCQWCQQTFTIHPSQVTKDVGYFCGKACVHASRRIQKPPPKPKKAPVFIVCQECLVPFRVPPARKETAKFCSRSCLFVNKDHLALMSRNQSGANSHRWKGGLYKQGSGYIRKKEKRNGVETVSAHHRLVMTEWMLQEAPTHPFLLAIDGVTVLDPQIQVHHIDRVRDNNARSNLLALTKPAHAAIHNHRKKPEAWECWPPNPINW